MKVVRLRDVEESDEVYRDLATVLQRGGIVCFPCNGSYRLAADLTDGKAVTNLFQSKRRVGKAPALVFVRDEAMLESVTEQVDRAARELIREFWPGPLTILFPASTSLPRRVVKELTRANGKIGVRVPEDPFAAGLLRAFDGPLLISSANRENKRGETSPAQVRKNFVHRVDVFVDAGDLSASPSSTVIDVIDGHVEVRRVGAIEADRLQAASV